MMPKLAFPTSDRNMNNYEILGVKAGDIGREWRKEERRTENDTDKVSASSFIKYLAHIYFRLPS